jgi:hypothetical protein
MIIICNSIVMHMDESEYQLCRFSIFVVAVAIAAVAMNQYAAMVVVYM